MLVWDGVRPRSLTLCTQKGRLGHAPFVDYGPRPPLAIIVESMELTLFDQRWLPKSVLCLRDYSLNKFLHDLLAGITVGLVAVPLAMAFSISSGLTPQAGIYCAVVTGFLISALGGSSTQVGGPTGAFVVVIAGIVAVHGVEGLFMCTVMAGVILVIMGLTGMGTAVKYVPLPLLIC